MLTKVTKIMLCLLMFLVCTYRIDASVEANNGKIGFTLNDYGRIRLYAPSTNDLRHLGRVNIVAALSEQAVCDYYEDQDAVIPSYEHTPPTFADIEAIAVTNNNYSGLPPAVTFRLHILTWNDEPFLIARYIVVNDSSEQVTLYLGLITLPQIAGSYGAETNQYDATHRLAYCFREGESHYAGIQLLSNEPYSYKVLDWWDYSPDPDNDVATDLTRYHMTADPGFDATMTAGGDGSIYSLNAGTYTIASGDSVSLTYGIVYAEAENDLLALADTLQKKYNTIAVSVKNPTEKQVPTSFSLEQNYPNPFNPTTTIQFNLNKNSDIQLAVYNLQGQFVDTIASGAYSAGSHLATWDGKDSGGKDVGSGVYIYRLTTNNMTLTKKMLLVR